MTQLTDLSLTAETATGFVRGTRAGGVRRWLGIPYAAATSGDARWQPPQSVKPWSGVRECTNFGDIAEQPPTPLFPKLDGIVPGENCLSLNIWAPEGAAPLTQKPVVVWIHGGGYVVGASAQPVYDGAALAARGDVVVVTLNYRLGVFGFLDFAALREHDDRFASNIGLRDVVAALRWVQANISAFGGDPRAVTVMGQSAGAASITTLMTMPSTRGLFHQAIAQSPPATSIYGRERSRDFAEQYLGMLGVTPRDAARTLPKMSAEELLAPSVSFLYSVSRSAPGMLAFAPVVDGDLVPEYPAAVFERGEQHPVPLLIGTTRDEAALFKLLKSPLMPTDAVSVEEMFRLLQREDPTTDLQAERIFAAYPAFPRRSGAIQVSSDAGIGMPVQWLAAAHARVADTFVYRFDQATPLMKALGLGAVHASELPYVFGTIPKKVGLNKRQAMWIAGRSAAEQVSQRMQGYWLDFIQRAQPGWQPFDATTRATRIIRRRDADVNDPSARQRRAWGDRVVQFK